MHIFDKKIYLDKSLSQIPRILTSMDRNSSSPSYGCCHRDYWLYKTSDFPDAVRQFGLHALAIVYKNKLPGNIYYKNKNILNWIIAGLKFWSLIQHKDGSFDEFYPNERGWVGPTAFTTFSSIEALNLIYDDVDDRDLVIIKNTIKKSCDFIIKGESEEDHLANHHAMACLAVWKSYKLLGDKKILIGYESLWKNFLTYCDLDEGWSREYDGIDPGYLSATISFLGKIYQDNRDPRILDICKKSIEMCGYFVYPNGFYAGSMGSRNTQHFYPHGFEIFGKDVSISSSIANKMLGALGENKLVPPEIMSDRYLFYRVPELLQCYIDYFERPKDILPVPYETSNISKYFPNAKINIQSNSDRYLIINLAKGGVVKFFDKKTYKLLTSNSGILGVLNNGKVISNQWIDDKYIISHENGIFKITGDMNIIPSNKYFNIFKNIVFRTFLFLFAWNSYFAHFLKGWIRKILMLGSRGSGIIFIRKISFISGHLKIEDEIINKTNKKFKKIYFGGEFFLRYVPQSRFFQEQELDIQTRLISDKEIEKINTKGYWYNLFDLS